MMLSKRLELGATFRLAVPVIIGQLGHVSMGIVDSVMVGRLGTVPLAAAALANSLVFLILVFGLGVSMGITPLVAMADGAGDYKKGGRVLQQGLRVCIAVGFLLMLVTAWLALLLPYMKQQPGVEALAGDYLQVVGISILPIMFFQAYRQFSEGVSLMWPPMAMILGANVLNVFFNWLFIFGHWGIPPMGLMGAGLSTLLNRLFIAFGLMAYVHWAHSYRKYMPRRFWGAEDWNCIRSILTLGLPSGSQFFFETAAFSGGAVMIGWLGAGALAAHQIALSAAAVSYMFAIGVSAAASVRVGKEMGRGDMAAVRRAGFSGFVLAAGIMASFGVLFVVVRHIIPTFYIDDRSVIELASSLMIIGALFQVSDGIQVTGLGVLRGMSDVKSPTIITFIAYWVIGLPSGYIMAFPLGLGVHGMWLGFVVGLTTSAGLLTRRFLRRSRVSVN